LFVVALLNSSTGFSFRDARGATMSLFGPMADGGAVTIEHRRVTLTKSKRIEDRRLEVLFLSLR
jgi:hypothetical protein